MNHTNQEKKLLKVLIDELTMDNKYCSGAENDDNGTYFFAGELESLEPLMEYNIEFPIHLRKYLEELWSVHHCDLRKTIPVITVAAFKSRNIPPENKNISDYIYEF